VAIVNRDAAVEWLLERQAREGEPLLPELEPYLVESGHNFGPCLKHPLVFDIPHFPQLAWRCNDQYQAKREALVQARKEQDWHTCIWLHERPYRAQAFGEIKGKLHHREYWELLGQVWTDSENIWQWGDQVAEFMGSRRPGRRYLMSPAERRALAAMPEILTAYRGLTSRGTRQGWSWTLDKAKAQWFSTRLLAAGDKPVLLEGTVRKSDVLAYFTGRSEEEIVVNPRDVLQAK
jgi:hypothetical protein